MLALGLNEALPLEFCDGALPDAELTVEAMGLSGRQSKRAYVVEQFTTQVCDDEGKEKAKKVYEAQRPQQTQRTHTHTA